eukprot:TRINITY_DN9915_c0_g1_i1.p1 TRINITY_DN9915_c0_g1~~TRINITY_DN9915_c0_g1_i1.p1  ORF type:complete len:225 (+),score=40.88 TRINITY_DN9915_c0_g1_i1:52-675(+)
MFPISSLYPDLIPPLEEPSEKHLGPTDTSNWVIYGRVIAGAYPGDLVPKVALSKVENIIKAGVTVFVCLQLQNELFRFSPYQDLVAKLQETSEVKEKIKILYFPIPDSHVAPEEETVQFIEKLVELLKSGENLYIHCWGGHGRTGTIIACLLGRLYDLSEDLALALTSKYHQKRVKPKSRSPQTNSQFEQVRSIVKKYKQCMSTGTY